MPNSIKVIRTTDTNGRQTLVYRIPGIGHRNTATSLDSGRQEYRYDTPTFTLADGTLVTQVSDTQFMTTEGTPAVVLTTVPAMSQGGSLRGLPLDLGGTT
jgi:hypothetical protein